MYGPFDPAMVSPPNINPPLPMDEDCLTLNIAAPPAEPKQLLPVMVWFHGGGHSNGASSYYPIDALVNASGRGVVVVSLNYRLGVFGFLGSAELAARGGGSGTGNYGIEDQRLALHWVQEHIAAFGGDPTKVTIFGESAGGLSVLTHLATPLSYQPALYHRAIIESGVYGGAKAMAKAEQTYAAVLNGTHCADVACLLSTGARDVAAAMPAVPVGPVIDGVALAADPLAAIAAGEFNAKVPLIIGHNREEAAALMSAGIKTDASNFTEATFRQIGSQNFHLDDGMLDQLVVLYGEGHFELPKLRGNRSDWWWRSAAAYSDAGNLGHCPTRKIARSLANYSSAEVRAYIFEHPIQRDLTDATFGWSEVRRGFNTPGNTVCLHTSEIVFALGDELSVMPGEEARLAAAVGLLWSRFATSGAPASEWPPYQADESDAFYVLDAESAGGSRLEPGKEAKQCAFWEQLWARRGHSQWATPLPPY